MNFARPITIGMLCQHDLPENDSNWVLQSTNGVTLRTPLAVSACLGTFCQANAWLTLWKTWLAGVGPSLPFMPPGSSKRAVGTCDSGQCSTWSSCSATQQEGHMLGVLSSQKTTTLRCCSMARAERMQNLPNPTSFGLFWYEEWIVVRSQGTRWY